MHHAEACDHSVSCDILSLSITLCYIYPPSLHLFSLAWLLVVIPHAHYLIPPLSAILPHYNEEELLLRRAVMELLRIVALIFLKHACARVVM